MLSLLLAVNPFVNPEQPHAPDPLPNPEPGTGRYYVTSATYQGATRYGRRTTAGHLTGRDPAVLPACTP